MSDSQVEVKRFENTGETMSAEPIRSGTVTFAVTGEWITGHARDRLDEMGWANALRFLTESISGLTTDDAAEILKGEMRLTGSSRDERGVGYGPETESVSAELKSMAARRWGPIVRKGGRHWRPYGIFQSLDENNAGAGRFWVDWMGSNQSEEFLRTRTSHYKKAPGQDREEICELERHHLVFSLSGDARRRFVLFERCDPPPFWIEPAQSFDDSANLALGLGALPAIEPDARFEAMAASDFYRWQGHEVDAETWEARQAITPPGMDPKAIGSMIDGMLAEPDDSPPSPCEPEGLTSGYIDREGRLYACGYHQHPVLARRLILARGGEEPEDPEKAADEQGWLRIQKSAVIGAGWSCSICKRPSGRQRHAFKEWALLHRVDLESLEEV